MANAQFDEAQLIEDLRAYIPEVMRITGTPGLNLALARRAGPVWEEGFGFADLARQSPMTAATVMRTGSMAKLYTATAVMQLVERGLLGLHDPLDQHLPFLVVNPLGERAISVYDLLTHRSGLISDAASSDFTAPLPLREHLPAELALPMMREYRRTVSRWTAKVGERYQYSNMGVALLGCVVETVNPERLDFPSYIQRHIFDPLGMRSSQFPAHNDAAHLRADLAERLAIGYAAFGSTYLPTPHLFIGDYPAGSMLTTPGDHLRLLLAYLNDGTFGGNAVLKPETVRLMLTPQVAVATGTAADTWTGLIWRIAKPSTPDASIGHGGAYMYGWDNDSCAYPQLDVAVVIMTNTWNMVTWADPAVKSAKTLITEYVAAWFKDAQGGAPRQHAPNTWAWKTSYVVGLLLAEQFNGALGIPTLLTSEMLDAMLAGARDRFGAAPRAEHFDPAAFRAGINDMLSTELTAAAIRDALATGRFRVSASELELIHRELGGHRDRPLPWGSA